MKCVFLIRDDLTMSCGKMIAQCGHGMAQTMKGSNKQVIREWMKTGEKIVTLRVKDLESMTEYKKRANKKGLYSKIIVDAGHTEVEPDTPTICVIGPGPDPIIDSITSKLQLL